MKSPLSDVLAFLYERHSVSSSDMNTVHFLAKRTLDYFTAITIYAILHSDMYYLPRP